MRIAPSGLLGRLLAHLEVNVKGRKALDRVYERIDAVASGRLRGSLAIDPFEPPTKLGKSSRRRLDARRERLQSTAVDVDCEQRLVQFIVDSPSQELARIRPHEFARRMGVRPDSMTEACLHACEAGLLELHWDILCPTCRISSTVAETLSEINRHAHCEACDLDFEVDFGNAVELIFRVHPEVREADLKTYCIGGPEHAPHVVAQVRMAADELLELDMLLDVGVYVLRGPQLPYTVRLVVDADRGVPRMHLVLSKFLAADRIPDLQAGRLLLTLENKYDRPLLLRIERTIPRTDVVTAAAAGRMPLFCNLFPGEVLSREQLSSVSTSTLIAVRIVNSTALFERLGDAAALQVIRNRLSSVQAAIEAAGGDIVRERDDRLIGVFRDAHSATQSALQLLFHNQTMGQGTEQPVLRTALHRGTTLTTTTDGQLDYVGRTVNTLGDLIESDSTGTLVLTDELFADAPVHALLTESGLTARRLEVAAVSGTKVYEITTSTTVSSKSLDG